MGDVRDPKNAVGAVVNERRAEEDPRVHRDGQEGGRGSSPAARPAPSQGYFVEPTVIDDVKPDARIAQEEIFGPVLAVSEGAKLRRGLRIANDTEYGLTGAVYSRDRERLERGKREFFVGNLYLNRKCTGALVGVHPFGGFNMSGTDSKAGGPRLPGPVPAGEGDLGKAVGKAKEAAMFAPLLWTARPGPRHHRHRVDPEERRRDRHEDSLGRARHPPAGARDDSLLPDGSRPPEGRLRFHR